MRVSQVHNVGIEVMMHGSAPIVGNFLSIELALWTGFSSLRRFLSFNVKTRIINYHNNA